MTAAAAATAPHRAPLTDYCGLPLPVIMMSHCGLASLANKGAYIEHTPVRGEGLAPQKRHCQSQWSTSGGISQSSHRGNLCLGSIFEQKHMLIHIYSILSQR